MKIFLEPDDLDVRIELIPLIDVIFCILVFFILGAVSYGRAQGLNLDLPTAETAQTQLSDTLKVDVDALGQIKIENTPVTEDQLVRVMSAYVRQKPQGVVVLEADKLVNYGQVARLIDTLQKVGGNRVALGAIKQDSATPTPNALPGGTPQTLPSPNLNLQNPVQPTVPPGTSGGVPQIAPQVPPQSSQPPGQLPAASPSGGLKTPLAQPSVLPSQALTPSPKMQR
jgi:biopolymer transport protein ExbD